MKLPCLLDWKRDSEAVLSAHFACRSKQVSGRFWPDLFLSELTKTYQFSFWSRIFSGLEQSEARQLIACATILFLMACSKISATH